MKTILKLISILFLIIVLLLSYLSTIGVETKRFNNEIVSKVKSINNNWDVDLKKIKIILNPFNFKLNVKTINPKLISDDKSIDFENIKAQIALKAIINNKFSIENIDISTKTIEITNLISFIRSFYQKPELYLLEKTLKKGYLIADIKLEFDKEGKIKNNYKINGFVKDTNFSPLKNYNVDKINFILNYKKDYLILEDFKFSLNNLNFFSKKISIKNFKKEFFVEGDIENKKLDFNDKNLELFINPFFTNLNIEKIKFSSNNFFSFKINKQFKFRDLKVKSEMLVDEFTIINKIKLKKIFPQIRDSLNFLNNKINIDYTKNKMSIRGNGNILFQEKNDYLNYEIEKQDNIFKFKTLLKIKDNPLVLDFLNYEKEKKNQASIKILGSKNNKNDIILNEFSLKEDENLIKINDLKFNEKNKIIDLKKIIFNYKDKENFDNSFEISKVNNREYSFKGPTFNADKLIENLLDDKKKSNFQIKDFFLSVNINKVRLDNEFNLKDFIGNLTFKNQEVSIANFDAKFTNDNKKFKLTINSKEENKITTLFLDNAKPIVRRYKFIKGFENGILDFYSIKNKDETNSTLKIYDFKLKELPTLTKILTLASLQGIADILSGEGIRFNEFEMNFKNKKNTMVIDEIYAIGPAISILMSGYVQEKKLISLRGTLVPATTINKAISSIPVLGKILVGTKTGEGVFGVSFKIKGPPKKLETSVNPIKTLTPRFITRTLENIKKN